MERWVKIGDSAGLHARLAARVVREQQALAARVAIEYGGLRAEAESLTSLLALGVGLGARVRLSAAGEGAEEALDRLQTVLEEGSSAPGYPGVGVSAGVGVGRALLSAAEVDVVIGPVRGAGAATRSVDPDAELCRLTQALRRAESQLAALEAWAQRKTEGASSILAVERALLVDGLWVGMLEERVRGGLNAEAAVRSASEASLARSERDAHRDGLREVLEDVARRVLRALAHEESQELGAAAQPVVLVARRATPSELLEWPRERLVGVVASMGGAHAHAALIARALGVPMVVGVGEELLSFLRAGGSPPLLRVDGTHGVVTLEEKDRATVVPARPGRVAAAPGEGVGDRPALLANADTPDEVRRALEAGAEGIGLARTERLFLGRELPPDEEEQYRALRALAEACAGRRLTLRLADLGGGKTPSYLLPLLGVDAMGHRGAALLAWSSAIARPHLRALARLAREVNGASDGAATSASEITLMVPMVATREEWLGVLARWRSAADAVGAWARLSLLIETPGAALAVEEYLPEAAEIALGTNDLAALLFGGDRERGGGVWHPLLQPVMLRLLADVIARAHAGGKPVVACGDAAGQLPEALVLWGLGVDALSVSPERLAPIGRMLGGIGGDAVRARARELSPLASAARVRDNLVEWRRELVLGGEVGQDAEDHWLGGWD